MSKQPFHFTLGPVQGFVAQARRTRDLWAGSYLLSFLSGTAMRAVKDNQGEIVFPDVKNDVLMLAVMGDPANLPKDKNDRAARVGSLPNRFKAEAENPKKAADAAKAAIEIAWEKITVAVWEKMIERANGHITLDDKGTKGIWDQQIASQWEIAWVIGNDGAILDQRKNLRTHFAPEEPGEKCTLCGERQALCGNKTDGRTKVKDWWTAFAKQFDETNRDGNHIGYHFLKEGKERLCAICTIKRIFPISSDSKSTANSVAKNAIDWDVNHNYPSTAFMSAIDWLKVILDKAATDDKIKDAVKDFIKAANDAGVPRDEEATKIKGIEDRLKKGLTDLSDIAKFSGDVFFPDALMNPEHLPLKYEAKREKILESLNLLNEKAKSKPTPFYAVLVMDGDRMGKLLSDNTEKQTDISKALAEFTGKTQTIVEENNDGRLIYAGGDDVLAMLPLDSALKCAKELKEAYIQAFANYAKDIKGNPTISAGIVYAHMNTPLSAVMKDAQALLKDEAKKKNDRDAFAVRVWKRGGPVLTFGKKWGGKDWVDETIHHKETLEKETAEFSKGFLYRFRELIPIMETLDTDEDKVMLLTAEYLKSREKLNLPEKMDEKRDKAEKRIRRLLEFSLGADKKPDANGLLFVRFLADKEIR